MAKEKADGLASLQGAGVSEAIAQALAKPEAELKEATPLEERHKRLQQAVSDLEKGSEASAAAQQLQELECSEWQESVRKEEA
eukprot:15446590-Alexandrium_andersonii.AAC.1